MAKPNSPHDLEAMQTEIIKTSFSDSFEIVPGDLPSEYAREFGASLEASVYTTIFSAIKPEICLDIGSNIGAAALFFAQHCEQVYAFEPNPYIYPVLQRNAERNKAGVTAFPFGLSDTASELMFYLYPDWNTGASSFVVENMKAVASKSVQSISAKVEIGDEVLAEQQIHHVDFIKIDTEGYEAKVLLGLKECIMRDKPVVALEWNADSTRKEFREQGLLQKFFSDYLCFGLGKSWNKCLYPTILSKIKRGILKNVLKIERPPALQKFFFDGDYELVFFIPERFSQVVHNFSFLPADYIPAVGHIDEGK
jgi:FkbM family methyltransferase